MTEHPEAREPDASRDASHDAADKAAEARDAASDAPSADRTAPQDAFTGTFADAEGEEGDEIPVVEMSPLGRPAATTSPAPDWTRTEPVRDDPGTLGEEARRLWDSVREQFVDPLVRNYPEAAGHLTTAGSEFAAALRALVRGAEQRWTNGGEERPDDGRDRPQDR